jgi:hypothetical protein
LFVPTHFTFVSLFEFKDQHLPLVQIWDKFLAELAEKSMILSEVVISKVPSDPTARARVLAHPRALAEALELQELVENTWNLQDLFKRRFKVLKPPGVGQPQLHGSHSSSKPGHMMFVYEPPVCTETQGSREGRGLRYVGAGPTCADGRQWLQLACRQERYQELLNNANMFIKTYCTSTTTSGPVELPLPLAEFVVHATALLYIPASSSQYWGLGPLSYRWLAEGEPLAVLEGYSSPFNVTLPVSCSAFETDIALMKSMGSIYEAPLDLYLEGVLGESGEVRTVVLCPPYIEFELAGAWKMALAMLNNPKLGPRVRVVVVTPAWDLAESVMQLAAGADTVEVCNFLLDSDSHKYWDYQDSEPVTARFKSRLFVFWRRGDPTRRGREVVLWENFIKGHLNLPCTLEDGSSVVSLDLKRVKRYVPPHLRNSSQPGVEHLTNTNSGSWRTNTLAQTPPLPRAAPAVTDDSWTKVKAKRK